MARHTMTGTGASPGIAAGHAVLLRREARVHAAALDADEAGLLSPRARDSELARLHDARRAAAGELQAVSREVAARLGADEAAVFEAQELFLEDPTLVQPMEHAIEQRGLTAGQAVQEVLSAAAADLAQLNDPYLSARAADLRDVQSRLTRLVEYGPGTHRDAGLLLGSDSKDGLILVSEDLTPSDAIGLDIQRIRGIVLAGSTPLAHASILARGLGLPLVVGVGEQVWQIEAGQEVLLDATRGVVLIEPDGAERHSFERLMVASPAGSAVERQAIGGPLRTADGRRVELLANVNTPAEAHLAVANGAEGVGLVRTEFVLASLINPSAPAEPEENTLTAAYAALFEILGDRPVVVRALDVGGDKPLPFLPMGHEANPFLGWRGIRVLLDNPELFARQMRSLLTAAAQHGTDLRIMFPMISSVDELRRAKKLVLQVQQEMAVQLARPLQIGVMIEVPAAALIADALACEADFFSIGTNDLLQYTLACDRGNVRVKDLCRLEHPAVLRLISATVVAAHAAGRRVGVCGEAASDAAAIPLLVGLGIDELSVGPARLLDVRRQVSALFCSEATILAADALT